MCAFWAFRTELDLTLANYIHSEVICIADGRNRKVNGEKTIYADETDVGHPTKESFRVEFRTR